MIVKLLLELPISLTVRNFYLEASSSYSMLTNSEEKNKQ